MKKAIFIFIAVLLGMTGFSQTNPNNKSTINFLKPNESNPGYLSLTAKPKWDAKRFNDEYNQLLAANKKKELYPILLVDNRFTNQAMPARYSSQNYIWVSTQPNYRSFDEEIASDLISGFINSKTKKHGLNFKVADKGYYTPTGIKY